MLPASGTGLALRVLSGRKVDRPPENA